MCFTITHVRLTEDDTPEISTISDVNTDMGELCRESVVRLIDDGSEFVVVSDGRRLPVVVVETNDDFGKTISLVDEEGVKDEKLFALPKF